MKPTNQFDDLVHIVQRLRKECPWDRKQTHESIKDNLIEEAYEAIEQIDEKNFDELKKELGDLLLHVLFHSVMADEKSAFTIEDVIYSIQEKLIRRHPHVFEDVEVKNEQDVAENWETIKLKEGKESLLDGIPKHLPALIRALRMQEKAANVGFDWPEWHQTWDKLEEELQEFKESVQNGDRYQQEDEFGDLLFSLVNVGRFFDLNAEDALRLTNKKFLSRFQYIEQRLNERGISLQEATLEQMDTIWNEAKSLDSSES